MSDARIMVYRSTPSNVQAPEALGITGLTIDLYSQYSPRAIKAYVDVLNILSWVIHGQSSPSSSTAESLPLSVSDSTRNAKSFPIEAKLLVQGLSAIIGSGGWPSAKDLAEIAGADSLEFDNQRAQWEADGQIFSFSQKGMQLYPRLCPSPCLLISTVWEFE